MASKRILLLGATGSIGDSTVRVVEDLGSELEFCALASNTNWRKLLTLIERFHPESVALSDPQAAEEIEHALEERRSTIRPSPRVYKGPGGLVDMVRDTDGDVVLGAISGAAGLPANIAALETGKDLALANKEALVMSGAILMQLASEKKRMILPVDSEHSAIFQSLLSGRPGEVDSIILTASGGPFRSTPAEKLRTVTKAEALNHPTWDMGAKITIDSATLMNKALEIIEARWLFGLEPDKIRVLVHPQSIVHSIVEFQDGSMICQLGPPDMRIPIQYALTYPRRRPLPLDRLQLAEVATLTFHEPDPVRFPALRLAYQVLRQGGTAPAVLNAANEVAVAAFLQEKIPFLEILACVERTLSAHTVTPDPDLEEIFAADRWARDEAERQLQPSRAHS